MMYVTKNDPYFPPFHKQYLFLYYRIKTV